MGKEGNLSQLSKLALTFPSQANLNVVLGGGGGCCFLDKEILQIF